jgi:transposase
MAIAQPPAERRLEARQQKSMPIMIEFKAWLDTLVPAMLPESRLGKAVHSLGQWPKLQVFLADPIVPLDNNRCENAIRPFFIGRRGWLMTRQICVKTPGRAPA